MSVKEELHIQQAACSALYLTIFRMAEAVRVTAVEAVHITAAVAAAAVTAAAVEAAATTVEAAAINSDEKREITDHRENQGEAL